MENWILVLGVCFNCSLVRAGGWGRKSNIGPTEITSFYSRFFRKLVRLNLEAEGRYLPIKLHGQMPDY